MSVQQKLAFVIAWLNDTVLGRMIKRVVIAALVAGVSTGASLAVSSGLFTPVHIVDLSVWQKVVAGAWAAALGAFCTAVQSAVAQWLTASPTLSALLALVTPSGRRSARFRKMRHAQMREQRPAPAQR